VRERDGVGTLIWGKVFTTKERSHKAVNAEDAEIGRETQSKAATEVKKVNWVK
jgi:hypothetical protein